MLKTLVLLVVLWGGTTTLFAQTSAAPVQSPVASPDSGAVLLYNGWYLPRFQPKGTEADTTGALLSMFRRRRAAGWLYTVPFIVGMSLALPISSTDSYGQTTVAEEAISPPLGTAILGGTVVGFIMHATMLNKAHLRAVDLAYAAGTPIPAKYRRRLNANHFAEAAYLREALRQQMEREHLRTQVTPR
ncbi:hypothetical protein HMJ29_10400 [Hymenobacter taeanensis]|uniref:Uncharacterized protein n=1 Tax=Hymenobacter taeanensis TaxID=2735321 RepID=A0A6M6BGH2_9BACT|nr:MULTISPECIES: hypothetical protein [Hymenobacter]QJX47326.1 hypothetical protein HMJ29_10400 [Hymenobacter taeanensis]UOQ79337.1 hypothetical protein MUN83_10730 [Hymenobacter sp. 5414T-23]